MSQKANPTQIGLFIVIGIALAVGGLLVFSSGRLFSEQHRFILYFDGSVKGLNHGSPVRWRGVTIGSVVEVLISRDQATNDHAKPVIIEIDEAMTRRKTDRQIGEDVEAFMRSLIAEGLRGRLEAESLVTGLLYVDLEILTDAPPPVYHQLNPGLVEIPTLRTEIEELLSNLAHFDIRGLSEKLNAVLVRMDSTFADVNARELSSRATNLLASLDRLVSTPDLTNSLAELRLALGDARRLFQRVEGQVDPLVGNVTNTLGQVQSALADVRLGMQGLAGMVAPEAPVRAELQRALQQLGEASRSIGDLAEFLQRNPNALILGRKPASSSP